MPDLNEFFFASAPSVVQLQLLEISHPDFSTTYRVVRNSVGGVSVTHEGPAGPFDYDYYPLIIKPTGSGNDLDQSIEITLGDLGEILPAELDLVSEANSFSTKPQVIYRTYRSDDLTEPLGAPLTLNVNAVQFSKQGAAIKAKAKAFNTGRVGVYYTLELFPMLRGT